jgi:hypothetical protein
MQWPPFENFRNGGNAKAFRAGAELDRITIRARRCGRWDAVGAGAGLADGVGDRTAASPIWWRRRVVSGTSANHLYLAWLYEPVEARKRAAPCSLSGTAAAGDWGRMAEMAIRLRKNSGEVQLMKSDRRRARFAH